MVIPELDIKRISSVFSNTFLLKKNFVTAHPKYHLSSILFVHMFIFCLDRVDLGEIIVGGAIISILLLRTQPLFVDCILIIQAERTLGLNI